MQTEIFQYNAVHIQCNTTNNHLSNENIVELTNSWQCQHELNIIIFLNLDFVADLLCWIALNYISVPNKWPVSVCKRIWSNNNNDNNKFIHLAVHNNVIFTGWHLTPDSFKYFRDKSRISTDPGTALTLDYENLSHLVHWKLKFLKTLHQ